MTQLATQPAPGMGEPPAAESPYAQALRLEKQPSPWAQAMQLERGQLQMAQKGLGIDPQQFNPNQQGPIRFAAAQSAGAPDPDAAYMDANGRLRQRTPEEIQAVRAARGYAAAHPSRMSERQMEDNPFGDFNDKHQYPIRTPAGNFAVGAAKTLVPALVEAAPVGRFTPRGQDIIDWADNLQVDPQSKAAGAGGFAGDIGGAAAKFIHFPLGVAREAAQAQSRSFQAAEQQARQEGRTPTVGEWLLRPLADAGLTAGAIIATMGLIKVLGPVARHEASSQVANLVGQGRAAEAAGVLTKAGTAALSMAGLGSASRAMDNLLHGRPLSEGLSEGREKDIAMGLGFEALPTAKGLLGAAAGGKPQPEGPGLGAPPTYDRTAPMTLAQRAFIRARNAGKPMPSVPVPDLAPPPSADAFTNAYLGIREGAKPPEATETPVPAPPTGVQPPEPPAGPPGGQPVLGQPDATGGKPAEPPPPTPDEPPMPFTAGPRAGGMQQRGEAPVGPSRMTTTARQARLRAQQAAASAPVDATHDVPMAAGESKASAASPQASKIYVDQGIPETTTLPGRDGKPVVVPVHRVLAAHEGGEMGHGDQVGKSYPDAHDTLAVPAENAVLRDLGVDPKQFNDWLQPYIDAAKTKQNPAVPPDLHPKPYAEEPAAAPNVEVQGGKVLPEQRAELDSMVKKGDVPEVRAAGGKQPWEMSKANYLVQQERAALASGVEPSEIDDMQRKSWADRWAREVMAAPRDANVSAESLNDLPEGSRTSLIKTHELARQNWTDADATWNLTYRQFLAQRQVTAGESTRALHRAAVERAIAAGKPVPPAVLADYPDLFPQPPSGPMSQRVRGPGGAKQGGAVLTPEEMAKGAADTARAVGKMAARVRDAAAENIKAKAKAVKDWAGDLSAGEWGNRLAVRTLPRLSAEHQGAANATATHAASRHAAQPIADDLVGRVFGDKQGDQTFRSTVGAVLTEDNLRDVKRTRIEAARSAQDVNALRKAQQVHTLVGPDKPFANEAEYQAALHDPEVQAAIGRWKGAGGINEWMDRQFRTLTGAGENEPLPTRGLDTGARINLKVLFPHGEDQPPVQPGGAMGNLANPRRVQSPFNRPAKGTGPQYAVDAAEIVQNSVARTWPNATRVRMYQALKAAGLAADAGPHGEAPTLGGKETVKVDDIPVPGKPGEKHPLYIRKDVYPEVRQALNVDPAARFDSPITRAIAGVLNTTQMLGPVDFTTHTGNMIFDLARSQGSRFASYDAAKQLLPGMNLVDAVSRLSKGMWDVYHDTPETRGELARIAENAGLRGDHRGGLLSELIAFMDKSGRLAKDRMFDNLVERGAAEDTPENRRNFINEMGNYNRRLRGRWEQSLKDVGLSPFVVAGKTFNIMGAKQLVGAPGFKAPSFRQAALNRAIQFGGVVGPLAAAGAINYAVHGHAVIPGVPVGAIYLGDDDKGRKQFLDVARWSFLRRGLRVTGAGAVVEGLREGQSAGQIANASVRDAVNAGLHPYTGPAIRVASVAASGYEPRLAPKGQGLMRQAYRAEPGESQTAENLKAAAGETNPFVKGAMEGAAGRGLSGATGAKGAVLGVLQQAEQTAGLNVAPRYQTRAQKLLHEYAGARWNPSPTAKEEDARHVRGDLIARARKGEDVRDDASAAVDKGLLSPTAASNLIRNSGKDPDVAALRKLPIQQAVQVYLAASPEEKAKWLPTLRAVYQRVSSRQYDAQTWKAIPELEPK